MKRHSSGQAYWGSWATQPHVQESVHCRNFRTAFLLLLGSVLPPLVPTIHSGVASATAQCSCSLVPDVWMCDGGIRVYVTERRSGGQAGTEQGMPAARRRL